jgi:hypothetical protein
MTAIPPSPLNPNDPNYTTDPPYSISFPQMTGDVAQSLASLRSLRLSLIQIGPKPNYDVHGHRYNFRDLMEFIDMSINTLTKEMIALQPYEYISAVR